MNSWFLFGVVRADFLADVAAIEEACFFDDFSECWRDFVTIFNCEIGDTFCGVNNTWGDDGFCGAGVDTLPTAAAGGERFFCFEKFLVGIERESGDDFGKKNPGAESGRNEACVFSYETDAGLFGVGAFENRAGVSVGFSCGVGSESCYELFDSLQFFWNDFVIVATVGVAGNATVILFKR